VDLGNIIDEIVPWIILLGAFLPYLKKVKKASGKAAASKRTAAVRRAPVRERQHVAQSVRNFMPSLVQLIETESAPAHKPEAVKVEPVPAASDIHEEGVRATSDIKPMEPVQTAPAGARSRELRRVLVWSEILQKKY